MVIIYIILYHNIFIKAKIIIRDNVFQYFKINKESLYIYFKDNELLNITLSINEPIVSYII